MKNDYSLIKNAIEYNETNDIYVDEVLLKEITFYMMDFGVKMDIITLRLFSN